VRDRRLCRHLQRAARAVARRFDDALRPVGLNNGQCSLLFALSRPEPPRMLDDALGDPEKQPVGTEGAGYPGRSSSHLAQESGKRP
jgi:hypothetical protein